MDVGRTSVGSRFKGNDTSDHTTVVINKLCVSLNYEILAL